MAIKYPSNLEYLGARPNFTRDSFKTRQEADDALAAGWIDQGHLSYIFETGRTYRAVPDPGNPGSLMWSDFLGDLSTELTGNLSGALGKLGALEKRVGAVESELVGTPGKGMDPETRLDQVWSWFDRETHRPDLSVRIQAPRSGRRETGIRGTAVFEWTWADRVGATGVWVDPGTGTRVFKDLPGTPDQGTTTVEFPGPIVLGENPITLKAGFSGGGPETSHTITPMTPSRRIEWSVQPAGWGPASDVRTLTVRFIGTGLPEYTGSSDQLTGPDGLIQAVGTPGDLGLDRKVTTQIRGLGPMPGPWTWGGEGKGIQATPTGPRHWFCLGRIGIDGLTWTSWDTGPGELPWHEYLPGSRGTILSVDPGIQAKSAQVRSSAGSPWTPITGFRETGTSVINGIKYYYLSNPNIGAGRFQFRFV